MIEVRNINKTFHIPHDVKALVDVSTKIDAGEVVAAMQNELANAGGASQVR